MNLKNKDFLLNTLIVIYPFGLMVNTRIMINVFNIILLLLVIVKIKDDGFKMSFLEKWIILFILGIVISFIKNPYGIKDGIIGLERILRWLFFPLLLGQFKIDIKTKKNLFYSMILGLLTYGIKYYFEIIYKVNFGKTYYSRYSGGYRISQISLVLGIVLLILLLTLLYKKMSKYKFFLIILLIGLNLSLLVLTQTRGMYLSTALVIFIILFIKSKKIFLISFIIAIFMGILLFTIIPGNKFVKRVTSIAKLDNSNKGRIEVFEEAFRIFKENPINGVGYNNFKKVQRKNIYKYNATYFHPHNMILKFASETGILGLLGYLLLNGVLILKGLKFGKNDLEYLMILSIILCLVFYEMTEIVIRKQFAYPFIYFILGILLNKDYKKSTILEKLKRL